MADPENSGAKNAAEAEAPKETDVGKSRRISPAQKAAGFVGDVYIRPYKRIIDKKKRPHKAFGLLCTGIGTWFKGSKA